MPGFLPGLFLCFKQIEVMSTKTAQGQLWSIAPQYWSQYFEPYFLPIYREVLQKVQLTPDTLLLDAGCGSGLFSNVAIKAGAQVVGIDAAPGLLEIARERNPNNIFLEEDLEAMPFTEDYFDVVVGFNSFQYAGKFENALLEAKRVLKPGGKLVVVIWDKPEKSDGTAILKAISTLLPPSPAGTPGPFALSEDGKIEGVLDRIGVHLTYKTTVACPMLFHSGADAVKSFIGTGPAAAAMKNNDKKVVEKTIARAFEQFSLTENLHFLQNRFLLFIAEK
jgi:SAM-dependent methyltransferase